MQAPLNNRFTGQAKLLLLTVLCFLISYPDAFAAVNKGIRIYQTNAVFGAGHVTVSPDGFRMENTGRLKFILVAKPPSWQVSVFRNDDKTFFTESLTQFEDTGLVSGLISAAKERFIREKNRESTFIWSGKKLVRVTTSTQTLKYLPLNGLPPQIERIIYATYKCPTQGGIPTGFTRTLLQRDYMTGMRNQGRMENTLQTSKIEDIKTDSKMFSVPPGYKLSKSIREVVAGSSTRQKNVDFEALLDQIK